MAVITIQGTAMVSRISTALVNEATNRPTACVMAIITFAVGNKMTAVFAGGINPVMTRRTTAGDITVIKAGGGPAAGGVTLIALCTGVDMIAWFAGSDLTIMTT